MRLIKSMYGEKAENQVVMAAFVTSGIAGNMFLYILFRKLITFFKEKLNKLRWN